ncbi:perforin-1-like [Sardina pilchardus]|uniref:perforin-1-like n=1 Tax=Sardina pilchardus TaxID=27697 RepID=UPI002E126678
MAPYPPPSSRLYLLHLGALLLLAYLSPALCTCRKGTPDECMDAPFVPGHDLVGEGFDIVKMEPKRAYTIDVQTYLNADNTCQVCENDEMDDELQKLPLSVIDWRSNSKCRHSLTSAMYESATELVQSTASQIKNDWKLGLGLEKLNVGVGVEMGMGRSHVARFAFSKAKEDYYTFYIHEFNCACYSFRVSNTAKLSREFAEDISRLPRDYNDKTRQRYKQLLNTYGTHYLAQVDLGGRMRTVSAIRTCITVLNGQTTQGIKDCLSAQLSLTFGLSIIDAAVSPKAESCSLMLNSKGQTVTGNYRYIHQITEMVPGDVWVGSLSNDTTGFDIWFDQLKEDPVAVSYSLNPLPMLITDEVIKGNVKTAIQQYLKGNAISPDILSCKSGNCCPKKYHRAKLQINLRATGLTGDWWGVSEAFATVKYGVDTKTTEVKISDDPVWRTLDFGNVHTGSSLTVDVYDVDWWRYEWLGTVHFSLTAGNHTETRGFWYSTITLSYSLTCDDHLGGDQCGQPSILKVNKDEMDLTCTIKTKILSYLDEKYNDRLTQELLDMASALDPRFKLSYVSEDNILPIHARLTSEMSRTTPAAMAEMGTTDPHGEVEDAPTTKKKKTLGSFFKTAEGATQRPSPLQEQQAISSELQSYLQSGNLDSEEDPLGWWREHQSLSKLAKKY